LSGNKKFTKYFSRSIPSEIAINTIKNFLYDNNCSEILEIGSRSGLWAALLQINAFLLFKSYFSPNASIETNYKLILLSASKLN
jgi:hypothetical protein